MSSLAQRLIAFAEKAGRELKSLHARVDGGLVTAEKANLAAAINEIASTTVPIFVGTTPPSNPSVNTVWVDTNN